jgi:hypothetical protein
MTVENKQSAKYAYSVHTKKLIRSMGALTHIAKVTRMVNRETRIDVPNTEFHEMWGENESDARRKMIEEAEAWIAARS